MLKEKVKDYFKKYDELKVLFFFDPNGEYREEIDNWDNDSIKLIEADHALFSLKYKLEYELTDKKIFLYFPISEPEDRELLKFPLTDLLYANKVLKIDEIAEFMELYNLKPYLRPLVKKYIPHLKTKKVKKLLAPILNSTNFEEHALKKALICSFLGFARIEPETKIIVKLFTLLLNEGDEELQQLSKKLEQIESTALVCKWLDEYLEVNTDKLTRDVLLISLKKLKYSLLMQNTSRLSPNDDYIGLKITSPTKLNLINTLIYDWSADSKLSSQINPLLSVVASDVTEDKIIKIYGIEHDYGYYTDDLIFSIMKGVIEFIPFQPEKSLSILSRVKYNTPTSNEELENIIRILFKIANIYKILNRVKSYTYDREVDYINKYTNQFFRVDYYYRKFIMLLNKIRTHSLYEKLDIDIFSDEVHKKYEEHLKSLNAEWLTCLSDHNFDFKTIPTNKQFDFYDKHINGSENKIAVIISDALRYEVAYELLDKMHIDPKHQAKIGNMLSSLPSNTKLGMANLLPHDKIEFDNGSFILDGISSEGLENRSKILQKEMNDSKVISFESLVKLSQAEAREIFKSNLVYIYHNTIDAIGDDRKTEPQTFDAAERAINELVPLIKKIHSSYNVTNVIVTADHGFLYNYKNLPEAMYEPLPDNKSAVVNHNRFSIINKDVSTNSYVFNLSKCSQIDSDLKITIPKAINRYKRQGHGMHYVHGGASLQEMIVPVIESSRQRQDVVERVTYRLLSKQLKIVSGAIKIKLIQDKPIGSSIKPVTLLVGLYNDSNNLVSKEKEIILDSTATQPTERMIEVILNLTNQASKLNFVNLKVFDKEKEPNKLNPSINEKVVNQTLIQTDF